MKNYLFIIFIILFSFVVNNTTAQRCGTSLNMQLIQRESPELYNQLLQIENHTNSFINDKLLKSATATNVIRIPVVVHVLYNISNQNISDDQVRSQIEVLNEDFRRQNADKANTPTAFSTLASDPEIEFFLACVDPNGNTTNGITRTQTSILSFPVYFNTNGTTNEATTKIKFASLGGHDAWPSNRYLNIWTCNLANSLLGYAQFPGIGLPNTDGVVIKYNCLGKRGDLDPTFNKGRTATHEVGHWLNLIHIWGDDDNNNGTCTTNECSGTDNIADTPNQGESNTGRPTFPKTDCCSTITPGVMFMNYMDYTDDAFMNFFTTGQTNRMRALFATGGFRECFVLNPVINNWCQSFLSYSGSSLVCSSGTTFTINNPPPADSILWITGPNLKISSGQNADSCTFSATGSGSSWVRVRLVNACGSVTLPQKDVWAGSLQIPVISGPISPRCDYTYTYRVDEASTLMGESFYWESDILNIDNPTSSVCTAWPFMNGEGSISCTVTACGVSQTGSKYVLAKLCPEYIVNLFPNPASDLVEISLTEKTSVEPEITSVKVDPIFNVNISTLSGIVVYTTKKTGKNFTFPVGNLNNGNYIFEINDDKNSYRKQFTVKH